MLWACFQTLIEGTNVHLTSHFKPRPQTQLVQMFHLRMWRSAVPSATMANEEASRSLWAWPQSPCCSGGIPTQ